MNPNPDGDQDQDFTLNFNPRTTLHILKTPTKFHLNPQNPSKVIVSTDGTYRQMDRQTDIQTDIQTDGRTDGQTEIKKCLFRITTHTKHGFSSKGENFFIITILCPFQILLVCKIPALIRENFSLTKLAPSPVNQRMEN